MKKGITIEALFYNGAGRLIGGSSYDFEGKPEDIRAIIHEDEALEESIVEFLAARAVRLFRGRIASYSYRARMYDLTDDETADESAEE